MSETTAPKKQWCKVRIERLLSEYEKTWTIGTITTWELSVAKRWPHNLDNPNRSITIIDRDVVPEKAATFISNPVPANPDSPITKKPEAPATPAPVITPVIPKEAPNPAEKKIIKTVPEAANKKLESEIPTTPNKEEQTKAIEKKLGLPIDWRQLSPGSLRSFAKNNLGIKEAGDLKKNNNKESVIKLIEKKIEGELK